MRNAGNVKPFQCIHDGCSKSYNRIDNLRIHEKTHKLDEIESDEIETESERKISDSLVLKSIQNLKRKRTPQESKNHKKVFCSKCSI